MIRRCTCQHAAQDQLHGIGRRVHNYCPRAQGPDVWRCTACGREKAEKPKEKPKSKEKLKDEQ